MLKTYLEYNDFANRLFIDALIAADADIEREVLLMSHILNAQHVWNSRVKGTEPKYKIWQVHDVKDLVNIHEENQANTKEILETEDPERVIGYKNSYGNEFTNTVMDMMMQALNHGTYHRGQIAQLLRGKGIDPPGSDYITFRRL